MRLNADFSRRVLMRFSENEWLPSPMPGVERKMLDRIGDEVARATTIVRYAPGSAFSAHTHDGGEEYLVLSGTFCDEHGAFPTGAYVRNPPTSRHTPSAPDGATILVKLHQFDPAGRTQVHVDLDPNQSRQELYRDAFEEVRVEHWPPGGQVDLEAAGGMEVFVIDGGFEESDDAVGRWDWLRLPTGSRSTATAGPEGARVWIKSGHLAHAPT
ncbi:cupin domain-containing protein [Roseobacter sinensis]|uniref:Cupin domain-containing protein n=1 Tax=Roseobacter sinensis TaxID=2931391 RepID=A0ABT3BGL2_9RHOB|nr:cupin domain-containing protein [Roseobacter sp. WL0113]MCV3272725.1 cupin domain-containing protein [Roseobacter sp. WL0113]